MKTLSRRSALAATAAFSVAASARASLAAPAMDMTVHAGTDTTIAPGVVKRVYSKRPALIPGFKSVALIDFIYQPGGKTPDNVMKNPMVCHVAEGRLRVVQNGKEFVAKQYDVWTCDTGTHESTFNDGKGIAVMRMTWLYPS
jgi:quercetin dioxygenase-like cupin family protein